MSWSPVEGKPGARFCNTHRVEFALPASCGECNTDDAIDAAEVEEASELAAAARRMGLPSLLEREANYDRLARKAEAAVDRLEADAWAARTRSAKKGTPTINRQTNHALIISYENAATKARDATYKLLRAATTLTALRDDWERTERTERKGARIRSQPGTSRGDGVH